MLRSIFSRNIQKVSALKLVVSSPNVNPIRQITNLNKIASVYNFSTFTKQQELFARCYSTDEAEPKKKKQKKNPPAPDDISRLDIRIGKIIEVNRVPDSTTLYTTKIDCGDPAPRHVVAGLADKLSIEELQNRLVVVLCNLKPSKLRGNLSEAMVLVAKSSDDVEPLAPPENARAGDEVQCEGYDRTPIQPRDKKKLYDPLAADLRVAEDNVAYYKQGQLYVPEKGAISTKKLKNIAIS